MKNRSFRLTAMSAMALTAVLLGSCSADDTQEVNNPSQQAVVSQNALTFTFSLPEGAPVTYALHDAPEWAVKKLTLFEFDVNGNFVSRADITAQLTDHSNGTYSYTKTYPAGTQSVNRVFAFVANVNMDNFNGNLQAFMNKELAVVGTNSQSLLTNFGGTSDLIPMSGFANFGGDYLVLTENSNNIQVKLKRAVARVDVKSNHNNLKITGVRILKGNRQARVAERPSAVGVAPIPAATTLLTKTNANFNGFASIASSGQSDVPKAAYLYEDAGTLTSGQEVVVQIQGKWNNLPVVYNIPFKNGSTIIPVKRNHLYTIELGEAGTPPVNPLADIKFKIKVRDWEDGGNRNVAFSSLNFEHTPSTNGSFSETFVNPGEKRYDLEVQSSQATNTFTLSSDWNTVAYTYTVSPSTAWLTASISGTTLTINTAQNTTGTVRNGWVKVKATSNGQFVEKTIFVKQN